MILNYDEVFKKYKNDYGIYKAMERSEIYKVSPGIYSTKRNNDLTVICSKKYPNAVVTLDSAFYYYKLTDYIPDKIYLSIGRHSRTLKDENVVVSYVDEKIINCGKVVVKIDGEDVNIYDRERLLVELIRKRNKIPFDYYKEIIFNYRKIADELDMSKIEDYIALFKNGVNIGNILLREVF